MNGGAEALTSVYLILGTKTVLSRNYCAGVEPHLLVSWSYWMLIFFCNGTRPRFISPGNKAFGNSPETSQS